MKPRINICHIYLIVVLLCMMNGILYSAGGFLAQGLQGILVLMSLYYAFYANLKYELPVYFKALNILLILFTIYGLLLVISGEKLMIQVSFREVSNTGYLKDIYKSLLPIYPFYVFTKEGLLKEHTIKIWFFIFLVLAIGFYYRGQKRLLERAIESGSSAEEFTSNVGYTFVALLPALVLFYKKPFVQYLLLMVCMYFIVIAFKRGAILCALVCLVWFMITNLKRVPKNRKWIIVAVTIAVVLAGMYLFIYMMENSDYFRYRLALTGEGYSSGRDEIYKTLYEHFINEDNPIRFLLGYGANSTLKFTFNFAHNDWLEIATNQGLLGLVVYFVYWICFYVSWRKAKLNPQAFMAIGMVFIIYLLSSFFSMSYNGVSRCAAMVLGYYLAVNDMDEEEEEDEEEENEEEEEEESQIEMIKESPPQNICI